MSTVESTVDNRPAVVELIRSCHPQPAFAVSAMAALLAVSVGRGPQGTVAVFLAVLAGQLSVGWSNDYLDAARDAATGRSDKPVAAGRVTRRAALVAAVGSLLATVPLSLLSGWVAGALHIAAVLSAWSYNLRLKATAGSVLPYVVSFGLLPAFVVTGLPGHPAPPGWLVLTGALLGGAAHFANVLPDLADDLATGVRGLPHRLGRSWSATVALAFLLTASVVLAAGAPGLPPAVRVAAVPIALVAGLVGLRLGRRAGSRAAFTGVIAVAGLDVLLLLVGAR
jgi:4-hydroxybenzoate polyprenyltransferase